MTKLYCSHDPAAVCQRCRFIAEAYALADSSPVALVEVAS